MADQQTDYRIRNLEAEVHQLKQVVKYLNTALGQSQQCVNALYAKAGQAIPFPSAGG